MEKKDQKTIYLCPYPNLPHLARRTNYHSTHAQRHRQSLIMPAIQCVNFKVVCYPREGSNPAICDGERFFDELHKTKAFQLNQLFWLEGSNSFLINLDKKATLSVVNEVLGPALDPYYTFSVELVEPDNRGEKFTPGRRSKVTRCKATIEREAKTATTAARLSSATFLLFSNVVDKNARYKRTVTYLYDGRTDKLKPITRKVERRDAPVDVGPATDTAQQVRLLFRRCS